MSALSLDWIGLYVALATALRANPDGYYVNMHTNLCPAGAARGQLGDHGPDNLARPPLPARGRGARGEGRKNKRTNRPRI